MKYGYARASTEHQDPEMVGQRSRLLAAGIKPDNIHEDFAVSGMLASRPGLDKLLGVVESGDSITVTELSRLGRSVANILNLIDDMDKRGITLIILNLGGQPVDTSTAMGRFFITVLSAVSRLERDITGERIGATLGAKARQGKFTGGPRRWGFDTDGVTIRESEAVWIRKAADMVLEGQPLSTICEVLNDNDVLLDQHRKKGTVWLPVNLGRSLRLPRMAGLASYRGTITGKAPYPAIIPEEKWREVVAALEGDRRGFGGRRTGGPGPVPGYLGSLMFRCGPCLREGREVMLRGSKWSYYCTRKDHASPWGGAHRERGTFSTARAPIDEFVVSEVISKLRDPSAARLVAKPKKSRRSLAARLATEEAQYRRKLDEVRENFENDPDYPVQQWRTVTASLQQKLDDVCARLSRLAEESSQSPLAGIAGRPDAAEIWETLPLDRQRDIIRCMYDITIRKSRWRPGNGKPWDHDCVLLAEKQLP